MELIQPHIESTWKDRMISSFRSDNFRNLKQFLVSEKSNGKTIYPAGKHIFSAFDFTPFDSIKVVLLGQDPYHGPGQAHGLCFSVPTGIKPPPSLINIFKELKADLNLTMPPHGSLEKWAKQGVLLLNTTLTVEAHKAGSHKGKGWEEFTDSVIKTISDQKNHIVFLLWGKHAQSKEPLIDSSRHLVLKAAHPSPFSAEAGFFGCRHFSKSNQYLVQNNIKAIDWSL